jgi:two-component system KDP operon response regulator KdpE
MARVLVVDGDGPARRVLTALIEHDGHLVRDAATVEEAVVLSGHDLPDLVVLEPALPGGDGLRVLERLRSFSDVPVVVVSRRAGTRDKVAALDAGADDYVVKPFDDDELLARLRVALRRRPPAVAGPATVVVGDLEFDRARGRVTRSGTVVHLTATELRLLDLLVGSDGGLLSPAEVTKRLRARGRPIHAASLRVFVAQLRRKLGDDATDPRLIRTEHGLGYRWIGTTPADA